MLSPVKSVWTVNTRNPSGLLIPIPILGCFIVRAAFNSILIAQPRPLVGFWDFSVPSTHIFLTTSPLTSLSESPYAFEL